MKMFVNKKQVINHKVAVIKVYLKKKYYSVDKIILMIEDKET